MKKTLLLLLVGYGMYAQKYPDFKPLRFDENYAFLRANPDHSDLYKTAKFLPLSDSGTTYLSFGGDIRYQYFYAKNETWGDDPKDHDGYVLQRMLLHADFHASSFFRAFLQVQSSTASSRLDPSPVDSDPLEIHQAFVDFNIWDTEKKRLLFRIGRQELSYGSQRLVAVRDGPNNRQSFDAAKLIVGLSKYQADFFYSHYVVASDGIFDDESNNRKQFWGSYFAIHKIPLLQNIDFYYLGYQRERAIFDDGTGKEIRHSVGTRIAGKSKNWRYDGEAVYQFGHFDRSEIDAWTASLNAGYRINSVVFHPEIGLKAEIISGDKNAQDLKLNTFNPLFPRGAYFGLASVIGPSNLIDVHPSLNFELSKTVELGLDYDLFWRYSDTDGIYAPNVALIYPGTASNQKQIGRQLESELVYQPNAFLYFRFEATWFQAGDFLKAAGAGKDIFFTGATAQLRF